MTSKTLEIIINGIIKGTIQLQITDKKLEIVELKIPEEISSGLKHLALLHQKKDYFAFTYDEYKTTLEKGIQKDFPEYKIEIREKQFTEQSPSK